MAVTKKFRGYLTAIKSAQRTNGWFAGKFYDEITRRVYGIAGTTRIDVEVDEDYDVIGELAYHEKWGPQIKIHSLSPHVTLTSDGIIKYLSSKSFTGIGEITAKKIVDELGLDTLEAIETNSSLFKQAVSNLKLTEKQVAALKAGVGAISLENTLRRLVPNISEKMIDKIYDRYMDKGDETGAYEVLNKIQTEPYSLLQDLSNVTFADVDNIALNLGYSRYGKKRLVECYYYALYNYIQSTQNVYLNMSQTDHTDYDKFYNAFVQNVSANGGNMDEAKQYAEVLATNPFDIERISFQPYDDGYRIYTVDTLKEEDGLALLLSHQLTKPSVFMMVTGCSVQDIEDDIKIYEKKRGIILDSSQRQCVMASLMSSVSIINGGPGHGKTSTVDCILFIWERHMRLCKDYIDKDKRPILAAPTGRAVSVLKNAVNGDYDVKTAMRIICNHNIAHKQHEKGESKNYLEMCELYTNNMVVLDECSMVGIKTAYQFLSLFEDCQIIFVGDIDQLPSIEYGQFFRDMCESNLIMKTTLSENHRVANGKIIIDNADRMNAGDTVLDFSDMDAFGLWHINPYSDVCVNDIINRYMQRIYDDSQKIDENKLKRTILLTPIHNTNIGEIHLNYIIQNMINPMQKATPNCADITQKGHPIEETHIYVPGVDYTTNRDICKLRIGDRVMQTKNRDDVLCITAIGSKVNESKGIYNGDVGTIISCTLSGGKKDPATLTIQFDDGRKAVIEEKYMNELKLAYATTIHKAQGSEYDDVILVIPYLQSFEKTFKTRNLVYTAVTRAKHSVSIEGDANSFYDCILNPAPPRNSQLRNKIIAYFKQVKGGE